MQTVLITGIAGFIGSNLAREALRQGMTVRGIDDLSTGKASNLAEVADQIDFSRADICDETVLDELCQGVDCIFHEAAIASVPRSIELPLESHRVNVDGTLQVLQAARRNGVKRVVFAASAAAYGDDPELPKRETMCPSVLSPYGAQKLASEHYLQSFWHVYGLETISLRYFNVFGPRQDPSSSYSGVLSIFIDRLLSEKTVTIYGDGQTSRDFTYIDNVVQANLLAMRAPASVVAGKVFNIATGHSTSLLEAYEAIRKVTGAPKNILFADQREGDIRHSCADITAAQKCLGYEPAVSFKEGLKNTIEWRRTEILQNN